MIRVTLGFVLGFILSYLFYKLVNKNHKKLTEIARNFPQSVDINLYKDPAQEAKLCFLILVGYF